MRQLLDSLEQIIIKSQPNDCASLVGELERLKAIAWGRIMTSKTEMVNTDSDLKTIPEVAQELKVSEYRAYELVRHGKLKGLHLGKSVRVRPADLAAYLSKQEG